MPAERPTRNPAMYADEWLLCLTHGDPEGELDKFEAYVEQVAMRTLRSIGIKCTVKRDKFSLPYTHELTSDLRMDSFLNVVYDYRWPLRSFAKELLGQNEDRIRFYLWVDYFVIPGSDDFIRGCLRYHFRYWIHTPPPPSYDEVPCGNVTMIVPRERRTRAT